MEKLLDSVITEIKAFRVYLELNGVSIHEYAQKRYPYNSQFPAAYEMYTEIKVKYNQANPGCDIRLFFGCPEPAHSLNGTYWILEASPGHYLYRRKSGHIIKTNIPAGEIK